jgi:hypothetical protein
VAFITPEYYNAQEVQARLREYDIASDKVHVQVYDPKTHMDKVREFGIQFDGTIVVRCGDKKEEVTGGSEEQLTSAILAVSKGEKTKIYFLSGHAEHPLDSYEDNGLGSLKRNLENQQYEVKELVLLKEKQPTVPADCAVLCIIGPQRPLMKQEIDAINKYLDQGGKAFVCVDIPPAPSLNEILQRHGVRVLDGVVFDPVTNLWGNIGIPLVVQPEQHEVTRNLQAFFFPGTRAFEVEQSQSQAPPSYPGAPPPPPQKKGTELLFTSESAWLSTSWKPGTQPKKQPGERSGRLCLAVAVDESKPAPPPTPPGVPPPEEQQAQGPGTRIIAVGDSDFLTQRVTALSDIGLVFALKSIAWLAKEEKLVSIPPKEKRDYTLVVSGNQLKVVVILVFALPVLALATGAAVWLARRGG